MPFFLDSRCFGEMARNFVFWLNMSYTSSTTLENYTSCRNDSTIILGLLLQSFPLLILFQCFISIESRAITPQCVLLRLSMNSLVLIIPHLFFYRGLVNWQSPCALSAEYLFLESSQRKISHGSDSNNNNLINVIIMESLQIAWFRGRILKKTMFMKYGGVCPAIRNNYFLFLFSEPKNTQC